MLSKLWPSALQFIKGSLASSHWSPPEGYRERVCEFVLQLRNSVRRRCVAKITQARIIQARIIQARIPNLCFVRPTSLGGKGAAGAGLGQRAW